MYSIEYPNLEELKNLSWLPTTSLSNTNLEIIANDLFPSPITSHVKECQTPNKIPLFLGYSVVLNMVIHLTEYHSYNTLKRKHFT